MSTTDTGATPQTQPKKTHFNYLLAFDGSPHSLAALELLLDLPERSGIPRQNCTLTLMTVLPTQSIGAHEFLQAALDQAQKRMTEAGFETQAVIKAGNPAATLNEYADEIQADLILIGAKGLSAVLGILLGGVAQQVVEYSRRPVLVVRAPYHPIQRVLVMVDGSPSSRDAVEYLGRECPDDSGRRCSWLPLSAELTAMHVLPPPIEEEPFPRAWALGPEAIYPVTLPPLNKEAIEAGEQKMADKLLDETQALLGESGFASQRLIVRGDAAEEALKTIKDQQIDLVVCGSRGLSAISGWLLGSLSRKLVHYANCSVLIVK